MKIIFRLIPHDPMEIIMGHFIWFHPCAGVDAISVTANPSRGLRVKKLAITKPSKFIHYFLEVFRWV